MRLNQKEKEFCEDLLFFKSIAACKNYLKLYLDLFVSLMLRHKQLYNNVIEEDANILLQMYFSRLLNISYLFNGVTYSTETIVLNNIIDPTVLFSEVRCLYESLCVFELIYVVPNSHQKQELIYQLFNIAGLNERQQFNFSGENEKSKLLEENNELISLIDKVKSSEIYECFDDNNKKKIDNNIKNGKFRIYIDYDYNIEKVDWDSARQYFGMNVHFFDDMYRFFSLHCHPSAISIKQFKMSFEKENPEFINLSKTAIRFAICLSSIFVADFIRKFPEVKSVFDDLKPYEQMLIDKYNSIIRGKKYEVFL